MTLTELAVKRKATCWKTPVPGVLFVLLLLSAMLPPAAQAQNEPRYFRQSGHYIRGAFRSFWETRGGLAIFGFPVTEEYVRKSDGRIVQFFERARFELTVVNNQAVVELGRLGLEITNNRAFPQVPPFNNTATRRYFAETGHSLQGEFKNFWETRGGVGIFGLPISEEVYEQFPDGRWYLVQFFERSRFELQPNGRVTLGLLGQALAPSQLLERWPPNSPPPGPLSEDGQPHPPAGPPQPPPAAPPAAPPGDPNRLGILMHDGLGVRGGPGAITPLGAPPGTAFTFTAGGFDPNEEIGVWLTQPSKSVEAVDSRIVRRDGRGNVTVAFGTAKRAEGVWTITAQGVNTKRSVTAPFKLTRDYVAPLGTPRPANRNGSVTPADGNLRSVFRFTGTGFRANETLDYWITAPDGVYYLAAQVRADQHGRIGYNPGLTVQLGANNPSGVYGYHYRGTRSGARVDLYFTYNADP
jgi:hypothetical protein